MKKSIFVSCVCVCVAFLTTFTSCEKEDTIQSNQSFSSQRTTSNQQILDEYCRVLTIAFVDVVANPKYFKPILLTLKNQSNIGDEYDYEISIFKLEESLKKSYGIELKPLLESSISKYSRNPDMDIKLFNENGYQLVLGKYKHTFSVFYPALNRNFYPLVDTSRTPSIGTILYSQTDDFAFPVFNSLDHEAVFRPYSEMDTKPIMLVSANINNVENSSDSINVKPIVGAGRCSKSTKTGLCNLSGNKCKCEKGGPLPLKEFFDIINQ